MNPATHKTVGILSVLFIGHSGLIFLYNGLIIYYYVNNNTIFMQAKPIPAPYFLRRASAAARLLGFRVRIPPTRHCGLSVVRVG
jgi:hypothetical protein